MKKPLNKLMLITIILSIIIVLLPFWELLFLDSYAQSHTIEMKRSVIVFSLAIFEYFGYYFLWVVFKYFFPLILVSGIILALIIARLFQIGDEKKWKFNTGIAFLIISTTLSLLLIFNSIFSVCIFESILRIFSIVILILTIVMFSILIKYFFNIVTTKKPRIILFVVLIISTIVMIAGCIHDFVL